MKRVYRHKTGGRLCQHPNTMSASPPIDSPKINRSSSVRQPLILFLHLLDIPGYAVHGKSLKETPCMERATVNWSERASLVPPIKCGSTTHCVPHSVKIGFWLLVLLKNRSGDLSSTP